MLVSSVETLVKLISCCGQINLDIVQYSLYGSPSEYSCTGHIMFAHQIKIQAIIAM